jgi:glutamate dehydrogenase/leucine dehydrogenase
MPIRKRVLLRVVVLVALVLVGGMAWMLSASGKHTIAPSGRLTGKPEVLQGVQREWIAARFVRCLLNVILRQQGSELAGRQVALVGFDKHAQNLASELELAGARVIAVTDSSGAVYRRTGLNVEMLRQHVSKEGVVFGFVEGEQISFEEMIHLSCDVLLLADGEQLKLAHAANMVVEVSGTVEAPSSGDSVTIPFILGSFGLSFADYLEWRKATCGVYSDYEMPRMMMHLIRNTWQTVSEYAKEHQMSLQRAGTTVAIGRVAEAMRAM